MASDDTSEWIHRKCGERDRMGGGTQYSVKQLKIAFEALKNPFAGSETACAGKL